MSRVTNKESPKSMLEVVVIKFQPQPQTDLKTVGLLNAATSLPFYGLFMEGRQQAESAAPVHQSNRIILEI